ncbi:FIG00388565: hypothetical protein [hydrothermal vent metagenome]|uniref:Uncharacterized protein n=1 Tax=hydrothermal vent metagenome TaxID=652676 RepID=A0A3B1DTB1_9ZZZZ
MIFKNYAWDPSDQPKILTKNDKELLRKGHIKDFVKLLFTSITYFPYLFIKFITIKNNNEYNDIKKSKDFYGLCINLDKGDMQKTLVNELGVTSLQIRVFLSDIHNIDSYVHFAKSMGDDKNILITIIQSREHINDICLLENDIKIVFKKFHGITNEFMIGNAINRIKWGFVSMEEYLLFFKTIQRIRDIYFPNIKLIGSSIIDFEYHFTIRTLFNNYQIFFDKISSLLYVDRRGDPRNRQYFFFDLKNKINFLYTIVSSSKKCNNDIYITEVNWPLKNTAPYAPTSELECVDEDKYTQYMIEYFNIAKKTNQISRVYWHQLISPGYGLVDNRGGQIKKTKAFYEFKQMILDKTI